MISLSKEGKSKVFQFAKNNKLFQKQLVALSDESERYSKIYKEMFPKQFELVVLLQEQGKWLEASKIKSSDYEKMGLLNKAKVNEQAMVCLLRCWIPEVAKEIEALNKKYNILLSGEKSESR